MTVKELRIVLAVQPDDTIVAKTCADAPAGHLYEIKDVRVTCAAKRKQIDFWGATHVEQFGGPIATLILL